MGLLQQVNLCCKIIRRVGCLYGATCLKEYSSGVVMLIYQMYRYARTLLARCNYSLVHVVPVHSLAAIFWKQRGVDIYDSVGIKIYKLLRNLKQEACKYYIVYPALLQQFCKAGRVIGAEGLPKVVILIYYMALYAKALRTGKHVCVGVVTYY